MTTASRRITRGGIAIAASGVIALLIRGNVAEPWPDLRWAYIGAALVAIWGLFELLRGVAAR